MNIAQVQTNIANGTYDTDTVLSVVAERIEQRMSVEDAELIAKAFPEHFEELPERWDGMS